MLDDVELLLCLLVGVILLVVIGFVWQLVDWLVCQVDGWLIYLELIVDVFGLCCLVGKICVWRMFIVDGGFCLYMINEWLDLVDDLVYLCMLLYGGYVLCIGCNGLIELFGEWCVVGVNYVVLGIQFFVRLVVEVIQELVEEVLLLFLFYLGVQLVSMDWQLIDLVN